MPDFTRLSQQDLTARRQALRRHRRWRLLQTLWRTAAISGLTVGVVTVATSPKWVVQSPAQIDVSGNQLLSDEAIYELLPLDYPQPLLKIQPQQVEQKLVTYGPLAEAVVSRRLFPPGLSIRVRERRPVAIAVPNTAVPVSSIQKVAPFRQMGLLDESGYWMPFNSFAQLNESFKPPTLRVLGMQPNYQKNWPSLYQAIQQSPLKITEVDWRDPSNLILQTDLGAVHFGPHTASFSEQLLVLDRMRHLDAKLNTEKIAFIDLRNPQSPTVQILQATNVP
ncbi:MAG: FtsQ-type POTRA domain-containing protein [Leptolyngbya sp. SIO4C1]|nr:FtsQ-type POTRA domain-containing protein [Leptolyngbya sp. SIO4C1]